MNYIRHLTGFFERVAQDRLLNPSHIALYIALFQFWNLNRFRNPISISRDELMRIGKISSKATYHKCLKLLHAHGYIKYEPSYNPYRGSHVYLFNFADDLKPEGKAEKKRAPIQNFKPVREQLMNMQQTCTVQVDEQAVVPSINNINLSNTQNSANEESPAQNANQNNSVSILENPEKEEKSSAKKEEKQKPVKNLSPSQTEVLEQFRSQSWPEQEALKFYSYYQSNGWLIGGKTPMSDWQAAAHNWMLNASRFATPQPSDPQRKLDTSSGKNYSEPL